MIDSFITKIILNNVIIYEKDKPTTLGNNSKNTTNGNNDKPSEKSTNSNSWLYRTWLIVNAFLLQNNSLGFVLIILVYLICAIIVPWIINIILCLY